jgi:hypothetical protein
MGEHCIFEGIEWAPIGFRHIPRHREHNGVLVVTGAGIRHHDECSQGKSEGND